MVHTSFRNIPCSSAPRRALLGFGREIDNICEKEKYSKNVVRRKPDINHCYLLKNKIK